MMTNSVSWICNSFFLSSCFQSNVYLLEKTCQNAGVEFVHLRYIYSLLDLL